jgi:radical SAM protein with 4Fe4S-binding SPASM domain
MVDKSKTICAVPWIHLAFEPSGKVVPCCLTSHHDYFAGDLNTQSIEEIWNSDNMKLLRKQMINGEEPKICSTCFDREKITNESSRVYHNKDFPEVINEIPNITLEDGTCTKTELKYWDFRFSNLCNFKCRSCGPRYSSAWVPDAKKMGQSEQEKVWNIDSVNDGTNFDFLKEQVKHVERIYFAGGEPLLMPEHWQILDMLVENKKFNVRLSYNTNASTLEYGKKNALDYWTKWNYGKVEVWPSIDEIGDRAELIRSGTVWSKVDENLKKMIELEHMIVRPGMTIGAWNVFRLPKIIGYFEEIGLVHKKLNYTNFFINLLQTPDKYHVQILPDNFKENTIKDLNKFVEEYNKRYNTDISYRFTHILHELSKPHNPDAAKKFLHTTYRLDKIRGESTFDTIPELEIIKQMYPENFRDWS